MDREYKSKEKNRQRGRKGVHKRNPIKGKASKYVKKHIEEVFDDAEMLRLQGLMRCNVCDNPFPLTDNVCPTCKSST